MRIEIETSKKEWENFISKEENTSMFQSWEWADFENSNYTEFYRYSIYNDNNEIIGILPIKIVNAIRGKYLHLRHSPILDWNNQELTTFVINWLKSFADSKKVWFIRISPLILKNDLNNNLINSYGFADSLTHEVDAEHTISIDLNNTEEEILKSMRKQTRYEIRKAQKLGIEIYHSNDLEFFDEFYKIFIDTVKRQRWTPYPRGYIKREIEVLNKGMRVETFISKFNDEYISSGIFIFYKNQAIYHHSGSLTKYRNIPSTYLLIWEVIKYAKKLGMQKVNLWGVCDEDHKNHPWQGLSQFKRGFGGSDDRFIHSKDLIISPLAHLTRSLEWIEDRLRGY